MGDLNNIYNPIEIYSNLKQSNSNNNNNKILKNSEKPAQIRKILGNLEEKKTRLKNPEKPIYARKTLNKEKLENSKKSTYIGEILSRLGINITAIAKASAFITLTGSNFNNLCTSYIASKQTQVIIQKLMIKVNKKLNEVYVNL